MTATRLRIKGGLGTAALLGIMALCLGCQPTARPGSSKRPVRFLLYPANKGSPYIQARVALEQALSRATGLRFETRVPVDFYHAVKELGSGEIDVALLNDLGFLLARDTYQVEARLTVLRGAGEDSYRGQLLVQSASDIRALADLQGKRVAFVDPYSVSGFVLPAHLLKSSGVTPASVSFAGSHEEAVRQLFLEEVDAAATYIGTAASGCVPHDIEQRLVARYPGIGSQLRTLATTPSIPNEPVAFRRGIAPEIVAEIVAGFEKLSADPIARESLRVIGDIAGFKRSGEQDYARLREILTDIDKPLEEMVPGGWRLRLKTPKGVR